MVDAIVTAFHAFRDSLYLVLKFYQVNTEPLLGSQSYWFSIVLLTISVRILLIPLTVKQVRASRAMSELAPEIKKLQAKYKNDREKLSQEMMALYKERGANPASGCLPILAQAPFFFALYHVIFQDRIAGEENILRRQGFFGVPLETHWWRIEPTIDKFLSFDGFVILFLIVAMSATTYISQRQLLARQAEVNPQQQMLIRIMPLMFAVFAVNFPLAVIIYWVTTNLWSMGQQYILLRNRPVVAKTGAGASKVVEGKSKPVEGKSERSRPSLRALLRPTVSDQPETKAQNGSASSTEQSASSKSSSNGKPPTGAKRPKAQGARGAGQAKKGSTTGRKPASPPRSGGGKSSARGGQRRRKR